MEDARNPQALTTDQNDHTEMLGTGSAAPPPPMIPPPMIPSPMRMTPPANRASYPPPMPPPQQQAYQPRAAYPQPAGALPKQHPSVTLQMSPRNLIIGGSVLGFLILVITAVALLSGNSSRPTPNIYSNGNFPAADAPGANGAGPNGMTTTTDANGNSVTMGPGAQAVQNADGSTTTTDSHGNTVTQGGNGNSGDSGNGGAFPSQQQSPFQGDSSFPQQQQGYPQQQQQGYPQQQGGYNPQQGYPR